jgi:hypothetical protein
MKRFLFQIIIITSCVALTVVIFATPDNTTPKSEPQETENQPLNLEQYKVNFTLHEIVDSRLNNELAVTIAVPDNWQLQDRNNIVQWTPHVYATPARIAFKLQKTEDDADVSVLPQMTFHYNNFVKPQTEIEQQPKIINEHSGSQHLQEQNEPKESNSERKEDVILIKSGNFVKKPMSAEEFIKWIIAQDKNINNVQIRKVEKLQNIITVVEKVLPELYREILDVMSKWEQNVQTQLTADATFVECTFSKNGKRYESRIAVIITYLRFVSQFPKITKSQYENIIWTVMPLVSISALEGKLDKHEMEIATILENSKVNPIWKVKIEYLATETLLKFENEKTIRPRDPQVIQKSIIEKDFPQKQQFFQKRANEISKLLKGQFNIITNTDRIKNLDGKIYIVPTGIDTNKNLPKGYEKIPWTW